MSATYLDDIVAHHRARADADARQWRDRPLHESSAPSLTEAISQHRDVGLSVIAEIKRRSPSKGWLNATLDAASLARAYCDGGAVGISVLTDTNYFAGSMDDLQAVVDAVSLPVLRKDFTVSENDLLDAAEAGASAVLLIVAALTDQELDLFLELATRLRLDALVEVHTDDEARRAVDFGAQFIGVNQRDLHTFEVDPRRAEAVVRVLPDSIIAVAESGLSDGAAAARAAAAGFDAVLVGESFVTDPQPADRVREFSGAAISKRAT